MQCTCLIGEPIAADWLMPEASTTHNQDGIRSVHEWVHLCELYPVNGAFW